MQTQFTCNLYKKPFGASSTFSDELTQSLLQRQEVEGFPLEIDNAQIHLKQGETIVIAGPNGVGKSALLSELARALTATNPTIVETFFGSRQIHFQNDEIDQSTRSIKMVEQQLSQNPNRCHYPHAEEHLKSVVKRALNQESQINSELVTLAEEGLQIEEAAEGKVRTLKSINEIFLSGGLPVRFFLENGGLRARRDKAEYSIDRLSDGERAALLVACAVLVRPPDSFIIVDEPERHLNPAISGPFLSALTRARQDVGFIFSTHDLALLDWLKPRTIVHLRDSTLIREQPEQRRYDYSVLDYSDDLPEELKRAVLGSRRKLLLVEGTASSEDRALYSKIYPDWHVVSSGGCAAVIDGVKMLSSHDDYHWLDVAGIVDGDGRSPAEIETLGKQNIFALPTPTIENLFLDATVISKMADAASELFGGEAGEERVAKIKEELPTLLDHAKDEIIARAVVWSTNKSLESQSISVKEVRDGVRELPKVDLNPVYKEVEDTFSEVRQRPDIFETLQALPLKNTNVPQRVASLLGYGTFGKLKLAVLHQLETQSSLGSEMHAKLKSVLPDIN